MLLQVVSMLKKKLGVEAIEMNWNYDRTFDYFKIPPTLIIPEGCRRIGRSAFENCTSLKKVIFPVSLEVIDQWAFDGCKDVKKETRY